MTIDQLPDYFDYAATIPTPVVIFVVSMSQTVRYRIIEQTKASSHSADTQVILVDDDNNELPLVGAAAKAEKESTS